MAAASPSPSAAPSWRAGLLAATGATLVRGRWWLLALAAFLLRGGILVAIPPILLVPSPARLASLVSPNLVGSGLTDPSPALAALAALTSVGVFVLLLVTTLVGAWLDVALVDAAATDPELARLSRAAPARVSLEAAIEARLVAHVPTAIALVIGLFVLRDAATAELTSPQGTGPLVLRILGRAPIASAAIVVAWVVGEAWGGVAVRRLVAERSVARALRRGLRDLVRPGTIATFATSTLVVAVSLVALWLSAGRAFERLWPVLADAGDDVIVLIGLGLLVASWAAGLWLLAIGLAFRSVAWTAEVLRRT